MSREKKLHSKRPLRQNKHDIEVVPSKAAIQSYFTEKSETDEKDEDNEQS